VNNGSEGGAKKDGFLKLTMMKVPDLADCSSAREEKCRNQCLGVAAAGRGVGSHPQTGQLGHPQMAIVTSNFFFFFKFL
jgi:hypothetical protein